MDVPGEVERGESQGGGTHLHKPDLRHFFNAISARIVLD